MNTRLRAPVFSDESFRDPGLASDAATGCAALAALSALAARAVLRACPAWGLLDIRVQTILLRLVSQGSVQESAEFRASLAGLMESSEWRAGGLALKSALERLARVESGRA